MVPPALRAALWLWALLLVALPRPTPSLGLFFRTSWAHEVRQPDSSTSTIIGRRFAASSRATSPQPQPHSAIPARQVSDEVFDSWFELIARGRAEGPSSPYYVDILGIQSVACSGESAMSSCWRRSTITGRVLPFDSHASMRARSC